MPMKRSAWRDEADLPRILDLVRGMPLAYRHVIDLPWRLGSLDLTEGRDAVFWENDDGRLVGFAACHHPWAALDFFILPGNEAQAIAADLFAWANARFYEKNWPYPYLVEFRDDDQERQTLAEAHGFQSVEDHYTLFQHTLNDLPPVPALPSGFALRTLAGEQEAAAYAEVHRAAFESNWMTPEWRARTIRNPAYRPELNLVVTAPDGSFAGFCVGWFEPARQAAQIEPFGVHPRFHQQGLGRILLLEILRRFKEQGATRAFVETDLDRTPARRAYEAVGFQPLHTIRCMTRWPSQPA